MLASVILTWLCVLVATGLLAAGAYYGIQLMGAQALQKDDEDRALMAAERRARRIAAGEEADPDAPLPAPAPIPGPAAVSGVSSVPPPVAVVATGATTSAAAPAGAGDATPRVSIVLLMSRPLTLDAAVVREAAERAWGIPFPLDDPDPTEFVSEPRPDPLGGETVFVSAGGYGFLVRGGARSFVSDVSAIGRAIPDARRRYLFEQHSAWCSVGVARTPGHEPAEDAAPIAAKLLAEFVELAGNAAMAVYVPATHAVLPAELNAASVLRASDPLAALGA